MATDYTREQLAEMERLLVERPPRIPTGADARTAPVPPSVSTAAAPGVGILVNFGPMGGKADNMVFLNPVVAKQLLMAITMAAQQGSGWWDKQLNLLPRD